jgi:hypothetical protein
MPQEPSHPDRGYSARILLDRPEFGAHIATVLHMWANIEHELANLMLYMLEGEASEAVAIYLSIVSLEIKLSMIQLVAKKRLSASMYNEFSLRLYKQLKDRGHERNRVAHARWAVSDTSPDGIVMLPHAYDVFYRGKSKQLYKVSDFVAMENRMLALFNQLNQFVYALYRLWESRSTRSPRQ